MLPESNNTRNVRGPTARGIGPRGTGILPMNAVPAADQLARGSR